MHSSTRKWIAIVAAVLAIAAIFFVGGGAAGYAVGMTTSGGGPLTSSLNSDTKGSDTTKSDVWKPFTETLKHINNEYYGRPVDQEKLVNGAASGLTSNLGDPFSNYFPPKQQKILDNDMKGQFEGIGIYVQVKNKQFVVVAPIDGSPAKKAGLKPKDIILAVDGTKITGMDQNKVVNMIRGPIGSKVTLLIKRGDREPFTVKVERAKIQVPQVNYKLVDGDIAYIQITIFGDKTVDELRDAIKHAHQDHAKGIILDLRNNGGGWVNAARETLGMFLSDGVAFYEDTSQGPGGEQPVDVINGSVHAYDLPLVVLVNHGTASASEITSGALSDRGRAKLVGEKTFGKGSEQSVYNYDNGASLHITIAHWLTPDKHDINGKGLTPDYVVKSSSKDDDTSGPQFDKAMQVLKGMIEKQKS